MAPTSTTPPLNLGFLMVLHEATTGYAGGYLVTNQWGRPLEFRLSTAVQPNRVQQILYGNTLEPYICADLIGKTLVEKTNAPIQLVVTDTEAALNLRLRLEVPVAWLAPPERIAGRNFPTDPIPTSHGLLVGHPQFPGDAAVIREILKQMERTVELNEPFCRIREAMLEARKMGVTHRTAA